MGLTTIAVWKVTEETVGAKVEVRKARAGRGPNIDMLAKPGRRAHVLPLSLLMAFKHSRISKVVSGPT